MDDTTKTLTDRLSEATEEANINVLRAKAAGFDKIQNILYWHILNQDAMGRNIPPVAPKAESSKTGPEPVTLEPVTLEPPPVAPPPEPTATPVPADDPAPKPRRGRPPRARAIEDAPSLLPVAQPTSEPEPAPEAPSEPQESAPVTGITEDDGIPW